MIKKSNENLTLFALHTLPFLLHVFYAIFDKHSLIYLYN